jgi:glycosyltransferase involved in cell wall biosynthesis
VIGRDLIEHGVPARKIYTVYNGVDVARFTMPDDATRSDTLASLGLAASGHRLFVTILANLWLTLKDHPTFLRAAKRVTTAMPDVGFIIAGEGLLLEPMRRLASELGLAGNVFFTGRCESVPALLSVSDVCVLSSVSEGFPNVIIEYMAAGRPVVTTDVGGAGEAVTHGETGYLVRPGDDEAMASHLIALLQDDRRRQELGARGREVAQRFSCHAQLERTLQLYERVLHTQPAGATALARDFSRPADSVALDH